MRKIHEIKRDLSAKVAEVGKLEGEERTSTLTVIRDLTAELNEANEVEAARQLVAEEQLSEIQKNAGRKFSFLKFIQEISDEKRELTGIEKDVADMGRQEMERIGVAQQGYALPSALLRAAEGQNYSNTADGGNLIETQSIRYLDALKDRLIIYQMGATFLGNLIGTIPFVTDSEITASWGTEAQDMSTVQKIAFSKATMQPKRCSVTAAFTKDLLKQTSIDVENIVMNKIANAHATLIESAAINGSGTGAVPKGILNTTGIGSVSGGTNGAAISWANIVAMETAVNVKNAGGRGKMGYLTNAKVIGALKTTEMSANNGRYLLDPNVKTLNGYGVDWTNLVPSDLTKGTGTALSAMIFGNFEDLYIGQWGGLDIVVDPYTKKKTAEVEITLNAWNDVLVGRPESFSAIKDIEI